MAHVQIMRLNHLQPLIDRLQSGSATCQEKAADAIYSICLYNKQAKNKMAQLGGLKPLVSLLMSATAGCQQHAAAALATICQSNDSAGAQVMVQLALNA